MCLGDNFVIRGKNPRRFCMITAIILILSNYKIVTAFPLKS